MRAAAGPAAAMPSQAADHGQDHAPFANRLHPKAPGADRSTASLKRVRYTPNHVPPGVRRPQKLIEFHANSPCVGRQVTVRCPQVHLPPEPAPRFARPRTAAAACGVWESRTSANRRTSRGPGSHQDGSATTTSTAVIARRCWARIPTSTVLSSPTSHPISLMSGRRNDSRRRPQARPPISPAPDTARGMPFGLSDRVVDDPTGEAISADVAPWQAPTDCQPRTEQSAVPSPPESPWRRLRLGPSVGSRRSGSIAGAAGRTRFDRSGPCSRWSSCCCPGSRCERRSPARRC